MKRKSSTWSPSSSSSWSYDGHQRRVTKTNMNVHIWALAALLPGRPFSPSVLIAGGVGSVHCFPRRHEKVVSFILKQSQVTFPLLGIDWTWFFLRSCSLDHNFPAIRRSDTLFWMEQRTVVSELCCVAYFGSRGPFAFHTFRCDSVLLYAHLWLFYSKVMSIYLSGSRRGIPEKIRVYGEI